MMSEPMAMLMWFLDIHVFPILCCIRLISRISWIELESAKHDWKLLKVFLCLPLIFDSLA